VSAARARVPRRRSRRMQPVMLHDAGTANSRTRPSPAPTSIVSGEGMTPPTGRRPSENEASQHAAVVPIK
jgi:hypothetical protein